MTNDELIKYIIWVLFFSLASAALYLGLKKVGVL